MTVAAVDRDALEQKVKSMYSDVAANPHGDFHFEMGRTMAERLGYAQPTSIAFRTKPSIRLQASGISSTSPFCAKANMWPISVAALEWTASLRRFTLAKRAASSASI